MKPCSHIRAFRKDRDMTQAEAAGILHCRRRGYSSCERGDAGIPAEALRILARLHNTSADYLLELTGDPAMYPRRQAVKGKKRGVCLSFIRSELTASP